MSRAIVRDVHTGKDAARLISLLMVVFSVSPILAPRTGSYLITVFDWRGIFWSLAAAGASGLLLIAFCLEETRPPAQRVGSTWGSAMRAYGLLLCDRRFIGLSAIGAFGLAGFFVYMANSYVVMVDHLGMAPRDHSVAFSLNALSFASASQWVGWVSDRWGLERVARMGGAGFAAASLLTVVAVWMGLDSLPVLMGLLFVVCGFLGVVVTTTWVLALDAHGPISGVASALLGSLQLVVGLVAMGVVGRFADDTPLPMVVGIAACAVAAVAAAALTLSARESE